MSGIRKLVWRMRNVRAKGSPSGLNQTSANGSPLYFKAAHCFEGGCPEKSIPHPRLCEPTTSVIVTRAWEREKLSRHPLSPIALKRIHPLFSGADHPAKATRLQAAL